MPMNSNTQTDHATCLPNNAHSHPVLWGTSSPPLGALTPACHTEVDNIALLILRHVCVLSCCVGKSFQVAEKR